MKKVQPDSIVDAVKCIIDGHPEDYVFVDYDSNVSTWLDIDYKDFRSPAIPAPQVAVYHHVNDLYRGTPGGNYGAEMGFH